MNIPDLWQLDVDSPDWLPAIITRLLAVGVPPTAISRAFDVEVDAVKELQHDRLISKYGTDELAEALHMRMWMAYEDSITLIAQAPPARRLALNMSLLARFSGMVAGQDSDATTRMRSELEKVMADTRAVPVEVTDSIYETATFDAPVDNPETGLEG